MVRRKNISRLAGFSFTVLALVAVMAGCASQSLNTASGSSSDAVVDHSAVSEEASGSSSAALSTYRTQLFERMNLPGPTFVFDYPANWTVTKEECSPNAFSEVVELTSDTGKVIEFRYGNAVVDSSFTPGENVSDVLFNPTIYPDLRKPSTLADSEWKDVDNQALEQLSSLKVNSISRSEQLGAGSGYEVSGQYYGRFEFWCLGFADRGTDAFTPEEAEQVVQILSSLRQEPASYDAQAAESANRIVGSWVHEAGPSGLGIMSTRLTVNADGTAHKTNSGLPGADFIWQASGDAFSFEIDMTNANWPSEYAGYEEFQSQPAVTVDENDQLHWGELVFTRE